MKLRFLLFLTSVCALTSAFGAGTPTVSDDVALYLSPDSTKPALLHLAANDTQLANAAPVMDAAKVTEGWRMAELHGPLTGYVESKTSHKDMTITAGTPVHATPDANSPVLGTTPANPLLAIKSPGIDWSEVSFPGPVTVYFQAPKATAPAVTTAPTPAPAVVAATPTPTPPPTTAIDSMPTRPGANGLPAVTPVTAAPAAKQADASDIPHYYYGVLKSRTDMRLGGPTNAHYVLYSNQDQVIALVDLNDVVLPNPIVTYLNKSVKLYGTAYTDSSLPFAVIHTLTLQAN